MMNETCDTMWKVEKNDQIIMMKMCIGVDNHNKLPENITMSNVTNITNMTSYIHNNQTNSSNNSIVVPSPIVTPSPTISPSPIVILSPTISPSPIVVPSSYITPSIFISDETPSSDSPSTYIRGKSTVEPSASLVELNTNGTLLPDQKIIHVNDGNTVLYIIAISMSTLVLVIFLVLFFKRRKNSKVHICKSPPQVNYKIRRKNKDQSNKNLPRDYIIEHLPNKKRVMMI